MNYVDEFEIISYDFGKFLKNLFNNIQMLETNFAFIENKIFLIINNNQDNIYEIVTLQEKSGFVVEYLINIIKNEVINDKNVLNNFLLNVINQNDIQKIINSPNPIKIIDQFLFNLYPIKGIQKGISIKPKFLIQ